MAPDINSLPTSISPLSSSPLQRPRRISLTTNIDPARPSPPSPRSPSLASLQAAAAINAGLQRSPSNASPARNSPGVERRRSSLMNNLNINDPILPSPGEYQHHNNNSGSNGSSPRLGRRSIAYGTADPNHQRQPSLGEIHQELENEQEAQVNRLLHMIRIQQDQLAQMQRNQQVDSSTEQTQTQPHYPTPPSSLPPTTTTTTTDQQPSPRSPSTSSNLPHNPHPASFNNRPPSLSRQSSSRLSTAGSTNSRSNSPGLRPASGNLGPLTEDFLLGGTRDESAFYQAETQMLTRENQMLRLRIRELERQVSELSTSSQISGASGVGRTTSPARNSPLATSTAPATFSGETVPGIPAEVEPGVKID